VRAARSADLAPSMRMPGRSQNHASVNTACRMQVSARVRRRVPTSRRPASSRDTNTTSWSGTSKGDTIEQHAEHPESLVAGRIEVLSDFELIILCSN
jgi:hypothetical protein